MSEIHEAKAPPAEPEVPLREVPVDWEALEDAFENNAQEVHSYLHMSTGEVLRVVDGVADPQMHARIATDATYLRIDPVSSREQYRWMERYIPLVEEPSLRDKLAQAIDGKGAFRRFKDVLMAYAEDREKWFTFRSERLRTFMEAWLAAHAIVASARPAWNEVVPESETDGGPDTADAAPRDADSESVKSSGARRVRSTDAIRQQLHDLSDSLGSRELDTLVAFAEFLKARRAARGFAHHTEQTRDLRESKRLLEVRPEDA